MALHWWANVIIAHMGKVLVDSLARIHGDVGGSERAWEQVEGRVGRELQKLEYLINAAVDALHTPSSDYHDTVAASTAQSVQSDVRRTTDSSEHRLTEAARQRHQRRQAQENRVQAMLADAHKRNSVTATADAISIK